MGHMMMHRILLVLAAVALVRPALAQRPLDRALSAPAITAGLADVDARRDQTARWLAEIGGFAGVSLQPSAGAHGEFTGLLMMRAYHRDRGESERTRILIPDSAHGTNPASTTMAGFTAVELPSDARGNVDLDAVRAACDHTVAGIMMTNPNTLGLFEEHIEEVVRLVHDCGGLVYGDGANMNALAGIARPGDLGFDVMHFNLHKTFATPHGGGGPGAGPVGVSARLTDFLPSPVIEAARGETGDVRYLLGTPKKSIGQVSTFFGNFGMFVRAFSVNADGNLIVLTKLEAVRGVGDVPRAVLFNPATGTAVPIQVGAGEQLAAPVFRPATPQPR